ncbi:MAG: PEGA domain-containing protein [Sandaracinaceae bacterium]|nr:PEGA domain-containing protein [Sandaracinaceae bacterium]
MRALGRSILVVLAASVALSAGSASAQTADELVDEGIRLREERRDADALERFDRAYELEPAPRTLAQIALAEQALARFVDAEAHLREALAADDAFIRRHRRLLEAALAEIAANLADLRVTGPAGATVTVSGREVGTLPLEGPVRVAIGTVRVEVRAEGFEPRSEEIEVAAGASPEIAVELTPLPEGPDEVEPDPTPVPVTAAGISTSDVLTIGGIAALGAGAVSLAIASGLMVVREDHAQARQTCSDLDPACRDHFYAAVDAETAGVAMYVVGGVLAAAGGALLVLGLTGERRGDTALRCAPALAGLACQGRF